MKKKIVPSAAEKTRENGEEAPNVAKVEPGRVDTGKRTKTEQASALPGPAFVGIDSVIAKVDKEMLEKADLVGIGDLVRTLMSWGQSVDAKFNVIGRALQQLDKRFGEMPTEDSIANKFMEKLSAERQKALASRPVQEPAQEHPQQQGGGSGEISALLKVLGMDGSSGGGSEAEKYFIQLGMETASLSNYMTKEMFKTVMPSAFESWQKSFKPPGAGEAAKT